MADITEDQIAAWERIEGATELAIEIDPADLELIKPFLPTKLTSPQAELPKEAGAYSDAHGYLTILTPRGAWLGSYGDTINPTLINRPLKRLVEEPEPITWDQVRVIIGTGTLTPSEKKQLMALMNRVPEENS